MQTRPPTYSYSSTTIPYHPPHQSQPHSSPHLPTAQRSKIERQYIEYMLLKERVEDRIKYLQERVLNAERQASIDPNKTRISYQYQSNINNNSSNLQENAQCKYCKIENQYNLIKASRLQPSQRTQSKGSSSNLGNHKDRYTYSDPYLNNNEYRTLSISSNAEGFMIPETVCRRVESKYDVESNEDRNVVKKSSIQKMIEGNTYNNQNRVNSNVYQPRRYESSANIRTNTCQTIYEQRDHQQIEPNQKYRSKMHENGYTIEEAKARNKGQEYENLIKHRNSQNYNIYVNRYQENEEELAGGNVKISNNMVENQRPKQKFKTSTQYFSPNLYQMDSSKNSLSKHSQSARIQTYSSLTKHSKLIRDRQKSLKKSQLQSRHSSSSKRLNSQYFVRKRSPQVFDPNFHHHYRHYDHVNKIISNNKYMPLTPSMLNYYYPSHTPSPDGAQYSESRQEKRQYIRYGTK